MRKVTDELQRKIGVCISTQLKNFQKIDVTRNFWLNSVYSNWLCYRLHTRSRSYGTENGFCTRLIKNRVTMHQKLYFGDTKMIFFSGQGAQPSLQIPPLHPTTSAHRPPLSEILNKRLTVWEKLIKSPKIRYFAMVREDEKWTEICIRDRIATISSSVLLSGRPNHKFQWIWWLVLQ